MRVLILGGTGAMGNHLVRILSSRGDEVSVTTRSHRPSENNVRYIEGNARSDSFLSQILDDSYDVVVDFMVRPSSGFAETAKLIMEHAGQYIFVSSYRVYADSAVLTEGSPRLLDASCDKEYLRTDEYALAKARCEDVLRYGVHNNWTIVRPGITFDGSGRFQLGTLEAGTWLLRALSGLPVLFPDEMLAKVTTLSWGGDVGRMIAGVVGNRAALGEDYIVAASEHLTWAEVADVYRECTGLMLTSCSVSEYERAVGSHYQIWLDRMLDRRIDNSKILAVCELDVNEIAPVRERLSSELESYLTSRRPVCGSIAPNARMDRIMGSYSSLHPLLTSRPGLKTVAGYLVKRFF